MREHHHSRQQPTSAPGGRAAARCCRASATADRRRRSGRSRCLGRSKRRSRRVAPAPADAPRRHAAGPAHRRVARRRRPRRRVLPRQHDGPRAAMRPACTSTRSRRPSTPTTMTVVTCEAQPRVLPWRECPEAIGSAGRVVGMSVLRPAPRGAHPTRRSEHLHPPQRRPPRPRGRRLAHRAPPPPRPRLRTRVESQWSLARISSPYRRMLSSASFESVNGSHDHAVDARRAVAVERRPASRSAPPMVRVVSPSRPAAARFSLISVIAAGMSSSVWFIGSHASPTSAARRLAAAPSPPIEQARLRLLDRLRVEHHRLEVEELAVVLDHVLGPQAPADVDRLVDPAAARGEVEAGRVPLLLEPARADPELHPTAGQHVERGDGPGGHEGVAQPDVVDVGAEPEVRGGRARSPTSESSASNAGVFDGIGG